MTYLPFLLNLQKKQIIIIGGGKVAARRLQTLLPFRQNITLISPEVTEAVQRLIKQYDIEWVAAHCQRHHLEAADMIIIATNDQDTNQYILDHAPSTAWINAAHHAEKGNLTFPVTLTKGRLQIAISTGGSSPILAKKLRQELEAQLPTTYEDYIDFLYQARLAVKAHIHSSDERQQLLQEIVDHPIYSLPAQQDWLKEVTQRGYGNSDR
ncbi:precorrin-2 dehydrogenase/sirohydrochlorin ferrochelatase family protein [Gracilibacillus alcaliphilus]|uniref:precorrin-2 dehydrogenase/sirohydrochlorin ferrochelatase family protein n=1 Tax=Gracilibacillus alcaliphilus TaxID=1401441 RepID=UPI001957D99F|nr:NAD(P)-dependent oxidoreductase [Gracilibacillus alcaliphilus]MBM7675824.1 precorrin-2 dehydrogenase/sirohydrochlorin ferrochelatase [Gracilibacillus alcaliphilus]